MSENDWAYRTVCCDCKLVHPYQHPDGSNFWSRKLCPKCGGKQQTKLCRKVLIRTEPFVWFNPFTWFPSYRTKVEFK